MHVSDLWSIRGAGSATRAWRRPNGHPDLCPVSLAMATVWLWLSGVVGCANSTEPDALALPTAPQLAAGSSHTCLRDTNGEVAGWGRWGGVPGQATAATLPVKVTPGDTSLRFVLIAAGTVTCGLTSGGAAYCWGYNLHGEIGDGTRSARDSPTPVATDLRIVGLAVGVYVACGIARDGRAYCWGRADYGALGTGAAREGTDQVHPVPVAGNVRFSGLVGRWVFCGLAAQGRAYCWGAASGSFDPDSWREPGDCGDTYYLLFQGRGCAAPTPVAGALEFASLGSGGGTMCGVTSAGAAHCWGEGWLGTLGNGQAGSGVHAVAPVAVAGGSSFRQVSLGASHVCGIAMSGEAFCWGDDFRGQLGNGADSSAGGGVPIAAAPVPVAGGHLFTSLATGDAHTCGLTTSAEVWCWGVGTEGQLGRPEQLGDSNVPVRVTLP